MLMVLLQNRSFCTAMLCQGWDWRVAEDTAGQLCSTQSALAPAGCHASHQQPATDPEALAECIMTELTPLWAGVVQGSRLLYGRLLVHSLGEGELCQAVCDDLMQLCIQDVPLLLEELTDAAGVSMTALRWPSPGLAQRLDCLAAAVQDAVQELCTFWAELHAALTAQCAAQLIQV